MFKYLILLVPEARLELAQSQGSGDFESPASTNSATPALRTLIGPNSRLVKSQ